MNFTFGRTLIAVLCLILISPLALAEREDDRDAIHALMWRYARALDSLNAEAYAAVYTPDGQFGSSNAATKGPEALRAMIEGLKKGRDERAAKGETVPPMYHMTADTWIEFIDDTHALHHSYWMTVFGAAGPATPVNVAAAGRGVDHLVKVNGQWLIQLRDVAPQD